MSQRAATMQTVLGILHGLNTMSAANADYMLYILSELRANEVTDDPILERGCTHGQKRGG